MLTLLSMSEFSSSITSRYKEKVDIKYWNKMSQSPTFSSFNNPTSNRNAVLYLPLSSNSAGGSSNRCKEDVSGAKLNHLVRYVA